MFGSQACCISPGCCMPTRGIDPQPSIQLPWRVANWRLSSSQTVIAYYRCVLTCTQYSTKLWKQIRISYLLIRIKTNYLRIQVRRPVGYKINDKLIVSGWLWKIQTLSRLIFLRNFYIKGTYILRINILIVCVHWQKFYCGPFVKKKIVE